MNKNTTAVILIVLAIGIYFTFTRGKLAELQSIRAVNAEYQAAIDNSAKLLKVRTDVLNAYNSISEGDKERLNKLVPDNVDNVRLIIDVKDDIAARHGLFLKNIHTSSPDLPAVGGAAPTSPTTLPGSTNLAPSGSGSAAAANFGVVTLSFGVSTTYEQFISLLKDLESSLRILDVSSLSISTNESGTYDFSIDLKTYWLKQ
jgi:hypothetical protein